MKKKKMVRKNHKVEEFIENKENEERVRKIQEAMELVGQAQDLVDEALAGYANPRISGHYRAYGRYGFDRLLSNGNPYDDGLEDLIGDLTDD